MVRKFSPALLFLAILWTVAWATGDRAALVLETIGNSKLTFEKKTVHLRTLQVLSSGSKLEVAEGSTLRLSYFKSGIKETIKGPCVVEVRADSSRRLSKTGTVTATKNQRNAATELDKSQNLRRMGGALQANTMESPESKLAQAGVVAYEPAQVTESAAPNLPAITLRSPIKPTTLPPAAGAVAEPKGSGGATVAPPKLVGRSGRYLTVEEASNVKWADNGQATTVSVTKLNQKLFSQSYSKQSSVQIPEKVLQAGNTYKLEIKQGKATDSTLFSILSDQERSSYRAMVNNIERAEKSDSRGKWSQLILLDTELGLWIQAEQRAQSAVKEYPSDAGFWFALGEIQQHLGRNNQAIVSFKKAAECQSAK